MSEKFDCLLLGYDGLDRVEGYWDLAEKYPEVKNLPHTLNSAITYLGTALDKKNLSFDFVNSIEDEFEVIVEKMKSNEYLVIGISTTNCANVTDLIKIVRQIKQKDSKTPLVLGGTFIESVLEGLELEDLKDQFYGQLKEITADYILDSRFGEEIFTTFVHNIKNNIPVDTIPNVYVRKESQFVCKLTEKIKYHPDEHVVNWDLFKGKTGGTIIVRTAISCCFDCSFCSLKLRAGKFIARCSESIEKELNQIEALGEVKLVHFIDDTFNVPLSRFKKHLRMFIKNKYTFKWHCFIRCKNIDEEAVQLMVESGCVGAFLGLESGNNDLLKEMNKKATIEEYKKGVALLKKYNITVIAAYFIGYPGETIQTAKETYKLIEEIGTFCYLTAWYFDPFVPIAHEREKYLLKGYFYNWEHKGMNFDTAHKLVIQMKAGVKNSTMLEVASYPFLFQMVSENLDITPPKKLNVGLVRKVG